MSLETESVLDRRNLKRRLGFWRGAAIAAAVVAAATVAARYLPTGLADQKQIARIAIEGLITEDRDMLRLMRRVAENKNIQAVILTVNSGGGTTTGGEALYEALRELSKKKPVVAQFGTIAASAAYIAGLGTDHIVARGNTITGSVGVIVQWPEFVQLMDKIGVKVNEIKSGPLKATPSPFEPLDAGGRKVAEGMVADGFQWFLSLVETRRGIKPSDVPGLVEGRIFSGREALEVKLVDQIGGEDDAVKWLKDVKNVDKDAKVVDWKPDTPSMYGFKAMAGQAAGSAVSAGVRQLASQLLGDRSISNLGLDGLLSVWHPSEK